MGNDRVDVLPGTLDTLVLKILINAILSDDLLRVEEASLYPPVQKLEGRKQLAEESSRYKRVTGAVAQIIGFA